ncbi:hypothetical protein C807_04068 [Lachnospiraceae bacterium 28-4]|nr:hypothetical protein C807_04068 [Lachnospiraceae bacterium 28-4]
MGNPNLIPYETIVRATSGEPEAVDEVLRHYSKRIRFAALADMIPLEAIQPPHSPALTFPGLEIRLHQRRVLKDGTDIYLTRLEYGALCYLAASPGRVFTKAQIFEAVWSMESESCQSNVTNVICNLRKKIEPDSRRPTYIKTVLGIGYKFTSGE